MTSTDISRAGRFHEGARYIPVMDEAGKQLVDAAMGAQPDRGQAVGEQDLVLEPFPSSLPGSRAMMSEDAKDEPGIWSLRKEGYERREALRGDTLPIFLPDWTVGRRVARFTSTPQRRDDRSDP